MGFKLPGLNPFKMVKDNVMQFDKFGKKGVPDIVEALDAGEAGAEALADFFDDFDAEEIEAGLSMLNGLRKPEKQRSAEQLEVAAMKIAELPKGLRALKQGMEFVEAELKEK